MTELDVSKSVLVPGEPGRRTGVSAETVPGSKILMQTFTVAPGESEIPGNDLDVEVAAYIISGRAQILSGKDFTDGKDVGPGDFYFTPVQLPHVIRNPHDEPVKMVIAYSLDPTMTNTSAKTKILNTNPEVKVVNTPLDPSETAQTKGMRRAPAISAETVGATQIWMCSLTVNPNERGQPHHHGDTHTAAYTISGRSRIYFGSNFEYFVGLGPGDIVFDPPGLVHLVDQTFDDESWKGVLARCPQHTVVNFDE